MAARELYVGWDVGGWNCDNNRKSRDAVCALELHDARPRIVGEPWRGNLRDHLVQHEGDALIRKLLEPFHIGTDSDVHVVIAIDTPLAWPKRMLDLVTTGRVVDVDKKAEKNPYLFREQELDLFEGKPKCSPLSVVRDMIGSQSTKGIHFLQKAQLRNSGIGVWSRGSTVAIETYPAAALKRGDLIGESGLEIKALDQRDLMDAAVCALVAWLYRCEPGRLEPPAESSDPAEGWIWLPVVP